MLVRRYSSDILNIANPISFCALSSRRLFLTVFFHYLLLLTIIFEPDHSFHLVIISSLRAAGDVQFPLYMYYGDIVDVGDHFLFSWHVMGISGDWRMDFVYRR